MDLTSLLLFCFMSLVTGAVLMLIVQYYIYVRFCDMPKASVEQKDFKEKYKLPEDTRESATKFDPDSKSPVMALNLVMQFLFHELKHTSRVRMWFYRKLSLELEELVTKTTTGKLFDKLTLKDLEIGDQFPEIKVLRVHDVDINESEGRIESLDLLLELKYTGNFGMAIDADMVLGKKASLTLKVKRLCGLARLQFTRKPYTHWSLAFLGDPDLDLSVESKFQGRQMQANVSSLISNQIRRAVRRKHTLPKYKLRYKPFFHKIEEEYDVDITPNGYLEVKISELSRLLIPNASITQVYCTLTMASLEWVEAKQKDEQNILVSIDVEIHKAKNQQIGIVFRQGKLYVEIEAVLPNTPAIKSNLKSGDILISIEGVRIHSIQQVAKIVKALHMTQIVLRIERIIPGIIRNDVTLEDWEVFEDLNDSKLPPVSKTISSNEPDVQTPSSQRTNTLGALNDASISVSNSPTSSPKKAKLIAKAIKKTLIRENTDLSTDETKSPNSSKAKSRERTFSSTSIHYVRTEANNDVEQFQHHTTIDCSVDKLIQMDDLCRFKLDDRCKFLNLCVYGKGQSEDVLLGFLNFPLKQLFAECSETSLIKLVKGYNLTPPVIQDLKSHSLSSLSGFDPQMCFGDVIISFMWDGNLFQNDLAKKSSKPKYSSSSDKVEEIEKSEPALAVSKTHNFIRTHFHQATQCDFCGKKIWLKDAVQCRECSMICHKKCVTKCQNSTVCGPVDVSGVINSIATLQPEFTVTEAPPPDADEAVEDETKTIEIKPNVEAGHRQSITGLIAQGLKRVNSANNLAIPGISQPLNQNSKSLPPSPQHSPRKQSLVNQGVSPFLNVTQILESMPNELEQLTKEQINSITEPIISIGRNEDVMTLAKDASKGLFHDLSAAERVEKINELLTKLRLALDSETSNHSKLLEANPNENSIIKASDSGRDQTTEETNSTESVVSSQNQENLARRAFALGKSEERVQALSVIMLYLCTGLQHAQGVASQ